MSFLPLSYSTTSLSTTHSACFTDISDSTSYTSDGRRDSVYCAEGISSVGGGEDEMRKFLLGPGWRDCRVPPAERLKQLYRLLEEHYDITGGDYYGRDTHVCGATGNSSRSTQREEYPILCVPYLESIGAGLDFLDILGDMSPDPMDDLINEAFYHPISPSSIHKARAAPISRWEIDWSRPLPETTQVYWDMMRLTRIQPLHEFTRAKPIIGVPRVDPQAHYCQAGSPQYHDVEENVHKTSRKLRAVLRKVRGLVTAH